MADKIEVALDRTQVKKAVQALQAFIKTKSTGESLFVDDSQQISLLLTLWKIPRQAQTIRIPLPHGQRTDTDDVCLFTRDEPNMTSEQTQRFYKKLLQERGVKNISEIIPYKVLRTEYKPYEAKRRLLGNFDMFLSDDRVRRLLPSHLGKHFYERKKEPLSVNLLSKHLARDIHSIIQGTVLKVNNKGSCCMVRIGHSSLSADELTENIEAAVKTVVTKLRMKGHVIKVIHVKSLTSVALPIYNSDLGHLSEKKQVTTDETPQKKRKSPRKQAKKQQTKTTKQTDAAEEKKVEEAEEEIPQLVPIETPNKKPKLEKPAKKKQQQLEKAPKAAAAKKGAKAQRKVTKTKMAGKTESKVKRRVPKVK